MSNQSRSLRGDSVEIVGNTTLDLSAQGQPVERDETEPLGDYRTPDPTREEPPIDGAVESNAREASLNGEPLQTPGPPAVPEEVTFWGRVVGLLLLGASVLKKLSGFVVALFVEDPLDNDRRQAIYDYLQDVGMAHKRAIQRATGIPVASLSHHLKTLRNAGLVTKVEENGYTVFFVIENGLCHDDRRRLALLVDDTRSRIARVLVDRGCASQTQIADELGLSQGAISKQINKLCEASLVEKRGGWPKKYAPSSLVCDWFSQD